LPDITSVFSYKISLAFQNACAVKCHQTLKDTKSEVFILLATLAAAAGGAFRPPALHVGGIFFSLLLFPPWDVRALMGVRVYLSVCPNESSQSHYEH
jgi:hypothetical protein